MLKAEESTWFDYIKNNLKSGIVAFDPNLITIESYENRKNYF